MITSRGLFIIILITMFLTPQISHLVLAQETTVDESVPTPPGYDPGVNPDNIPKGCLIATATFGSELAPQVQFLREIRDNALLTTQSGTSFMTAFNAFYYSFSPTIADLERQNPVFKDAVKLTITPLITTLSLLQHVNIDSEAEVLVYGIGIILLNIGMYFVAPAVVVIKIRYHFTHKQ